MQIPAFINGVSVTFGDGVVNDVDSKVVSGLEACIETGVAAGSTLLQVHISSAFDSHQMPSRHMQHKAVDISRINGTKVVIGYPQGGDVARIVDAIQTRFEDYDACRENFGPFLKHKLGAEYPVVGHEDHIHLSVN